MKILHVYKDYFPVLGGIENYVRQLAEHQVGQGHTVEVLVTNPSRSTLQQELAGVKIIKAGRWLKLASTPLSVALPLELYRRLLSAQPPQIIHLHSPYPVGETAWLLGSWLPRLRRNRSKVVLTYYSDVVRQRRLLALYAPVLRAVLRRVDVIIALSQNYLETSPFLQPVAAKCRIIPLGVDANRFDHPNPQAAGQIRAKYAASDEVLVLFAGRLREYKGLPFLLEALPLLSPTGPKVRLLIIGVGPMEGLLKAQVAQLGLEEQVVFLGEVDDPALPNYYGACDIFVLPSHQRSEAYGIVQLEAMAAGKPVISTELGTGTSFVNLDRETGLVVPPANPQALADAIAELAASSQLRAELGNRGQARVHSEFGLEQLLAQVEQLYMALSSSPALSS